VKSLVIFQGIVEVQDQEVEVVMEVEGVVTAVGVVVVDMVVVEDVQGLVVDQMVEIEEEDHVQIQEVALEIDLIETGLAQDQKIEHKRDALEVNKMKRDQNHDLEVTQGKTEKIKKNQDRNPDHDPEVHQVEKAEKINKNQDQEVDPTTETMLVHMMIVLNAILKIQNKVMERVAMMKNKQFEIF